MSILLYKLIYEILLPSLCITIIISVILAILMYKEYKVNKRRQMYDKYITSA